MRVARTRSESRPLTQLGTAILGLVVPLTYIIYCIVTLAPYTNDLKTIDISSLRTIITHGTWGSSTVAPSPSGTVAPSFSPTPTSVAETPWNCDEWPQCA